MQRDEKAFLLEMLFAAKRVIQFTQAITEDGFMQSELHQSAVARELMVIGEAARQISDVTRKNNPEIEWSAMVGMQNWLIHGYFNTKWDIVWTTGANDIPRLINYLEKIITQNQDGDERDDNSND